MLCMLLTEKMTTAFQTALPKDTEFIQYHICNAFVSLLKLRNALNPKKLNTIAIVLNNTKNGENDMRRKGPPLLLMVVKKTSGTNPTAIPNRMAPNPMYSKMGIKILKLIKKLKIPNKK